MRFNLSRSLQQATMNITVKSLLTDAASIGLGIVLMLLLTNDHPIIIGLGICITVGLGITAWRGLKIIITYRLLPKKMISCNETKHFKQLITKQDRLKSLLFDNYTTARYLDKHPFNNSDLSLVFYSSGQNLKLALGHINLMIYTENLRNYFEVFNTKSLDKIEVIYYHKSSVRVNPSSKIYNVKRRGN